MRAFHKNLCTTRVLDPACGSGNFLYVTMEHMKRLEGQVIRALYDLGDENLTFEMTEFKVRPHQFLGLEINPRTVPIAELVLWIGYLQWQFRTTENPVLDDPVIVKHHSIKEQDAVLAYDEKIPLKDADGKVVTHWDGRTTRTDPLTGREVPRRHRPHHRLRVRQPEPRRVARGGLRRWKSAVHWCSTTSNDRRRRLRKCIM